MCYDIRKGPKIFVMAIVLGIDPGSRVTGYGLVKSVDRAINYIASGRIITDPKSTLPEKLEVIYKGVSEIVAEFEPTELAIEKVFVSKSASSALKLGQARGAAIVAGVRGGAVVKEYEARKIKQSIVGTGAATKEQVQKMVQSMLGLSGLPQQDAADALATAICHIHTQFSVRIIENSNDNQEQISVFRRGRYGAAEDGSR